MEEPDLNGFLPFLNTKARIQDGLKEFGWYKKPSSKNIIIHSRSAHPIYMKANVIRNIRQTKDKIGGVASSSNDDELERILEENGYSKDVIRTWYPFSPPDGIPMVLPFVNDRTAREVNRIVRRSSLPIRLVFKPPPDLKDLLTSSRQYEEKCETAQCRYCVDKKICELRGTVYLITCRECGQKYVGETSRPLHKRLNEHRRALQNPSSYSSSSFSRHRTLVHTQAPAPEFDVTILHRFLENPLERKMMEAVEIRRRTPEINSKDEQLEALRLIS
ncbi:hypothetical protein Y032_0043g880 [Ancylostoma ceylanicum]|uniref:GIY-YIG domain-containing protein n=1 Tax=Ancylostoma ceylanicum TaxID=53326 RepID=A0A016UGH7_9BILA|nr:hypothetical protein Y032_0043g880 [Ancylostoma ceylanicum]